MAVWWGVVCKNATGHTFDSERYSDVYMGQGTLGCWFGGRRGWLRASRSVPQRTASRSRAVPHPQSCLRTRSGYDLPIRTDHFVDGGEFFHIVKHSVYPWLVWHFVLQLVWRLLNASVGKYDGWQCRKPAKVLCELLGCTWVPRSLYSQRPFSSDLFSHESGDARFGWHVQVSVGLPVWAELQDHRWVWWTH